MAPSGPFRAPIPPSGPDRARLRRRALLIKLEGGVLSKSGGEVGPGWVPRGGCGAVGDRLSSFFPRVRLRRGVVCGVVCGVVRGVVVNDLGT